MIRVGVMNYGVGNLRSIANALKFIDADPVVSDDAKTLLACDRIIFPGVGSYGYSMQALIKNRLQETVPEAAKAEIPVLGICVGMQLLFESSTEFGHNKGIGYLSGQVQQLKEGNNKGQLLRLPNVGWAPLTISNPNIGMADKMLKGVDPNAKFYFIHSFHAEAKNSNTVATSEYAGHPFVAVVAKGSVVGTQFHPEKSGPDGLKMLRNFVH